MANGHLTETLLRLATSRQNAAAIAGDLVESNASSSSHLLTILRMYAAATWRYAAGAILGLPVAYGTLRMSAEILEHRLSSANFSGDSRWIFWSFMLTFCSVTFSCIGSLSLVRLGGRNSQTKMAFCIAGATMLVATLTWLPHSAFLVVGLLTAGALMAIARPRTRWPFLATASTALLSAVTFTASFAGLAASIFHKVPTVTAFYTVMTSSWIAAVLIASITISAWHTRLGRPVAE